MITREEASADAGWLAIKMIAFVLMVFDHVDAALYGGNLGIHHTIGRVVFPLFAMTIAFNAGVVDTRKLISVVALRMYVVGVIAIVPYIYLFGLGRLNVMFTLAGCAFAVAQWRNGQKIAAVMAAAIVVVACDYGWQAVLAVGGAWWAFRAGASLTVAASVAAGASCLHSQSWWPMAAVPIVAGARLIGGEAPRLKEFFYVGYPAHLAMIAVVKLMLVS